MGDCVRTGVHRGSTSTDGSDAVDGDVEVTALVSKATPLPTSPTTPSGVSHGFACGAPRCVTAVAAVSVLAMGLGLGLGLALRRRHDQPAPSPSPAPTWRLLEDADCPSYTRDLGGNRGMASCVKAAAPGAMLVRDASITASS